MMTQEQKAHPVEFVSLKSHGKSNRNRSRKTNSNSNKPRTGSFGKFSSFSCEEGFISQLSLMDPDDSFNTTRCSVTQPSVTRTYDTNDSDDSDDSDDDVSVDLIAQMISDDEQSLNLESGTEIRTTAKHSDDDASVDLIAQMISNDDQSIHSEDDDSVDLIAQMISNDDQSIHSETGTENRSTAEYLTSAAHAITRRCLERNRKLYPPVSCESTPLTPEPFRSNRVMEMRNRLRSLEVQHIEQKDTPFTNTIIPSFHVDTSIDMKDSTICKDDTDSSLPEIKSRRKSNAKSLKQNLTECGGEIILINLLFGFLYLIFVLYKNAITMVMEDIRVSDA